MNYNGTMPRLGLGKVIATGWHIFWANIRVVLPLLLIVYLPINVLLEWIPVDQFAGGDTWQTLKVEVRLAQLADLLVGSVAVMGLAKVVESFASGQPISWRQALNHGVSRWSAALGTSALGGLIVLGMTFLLIVPGIIWGLYYVFVLFVVALRGISGKEALDYSKRMVKGQWWRVFGYIFAIQSLALGLAMLLGVLFSFMGDSMAVYVLIGTLGNGVNLLFMCMTLVFFLDNDVEYRNLWALKKEEERKKKERVFNP